MRAKVLISMFSIIIVINLLAVEVDAAETDVVGVSYRGDDERFGLALLNQSVIYDNLTLNLYSSESVNYSIYVNDNLSKTGVVDFKEQVFLHLGDVNMLRLTVYLGNDSYEYTCRVIHRSLQDFLELEFEEFLFTGSDVRSARMNTAFAMIIGMGFAFGAVCWYLIPKIRQEIKGVI